MRHWASTSSGATSVWTVSIPSRGTLVLAADGDIVAQIESALTSAGARADASWSGELEVVVAAADGGSRVLIGTEEFAGYGGRYAETWQISGFSESGDLRATIILDTVVTQS